MHRKGFAPIAIVLMVVAVLVVGGIWYYEAHQSQPTLSPVGNSSSTVTTATQSSTVTEKNATATVAGGVLYHAKNDLANPGNLTANQIASYQRCDRGIMPTSTPLFRTCSIGQNIGLYFIVKSISLNNAVSFYVYSVQPTQFPGETWTPTISTYAINQVLLNQCGRKISIDSVNYSKQNFMIKVSEGDGGCPQ